MLNRLIGRAGDTPVVTESAGTKSTIISTTPEEALAALDASAGDSYDAYCGECPDSASAIGRSA